MSAMSSQKYTSCSGARGGGWCHYDHLLRMGRYSSYCPQIFLGEQTFNIHLYMIYTRIHFFWNFSANIYSILPILSNFGKNSTLYLMLFSTKPIVRKDKFLWKCNNIYSCPWCGVSWLAVTRSALTGGQWVPGKLNKHRPPSYF